MFLQSQENTRDDFYYQVYGIGPQRINTEGIACLKAFFLISQTGETFY